MKKILLVLMFFPVLLFSQTQTTRPTVAVASTTNAATYSLGAFTPANNSLLTVFVFATGTVATAPTMSGGSLGWTREVRQVIGADMWVMFWAKVTTGVSTTITFDCTGDNATGAVINMLQTTAYDAVTPNPIKQTFVSTANTTSTNPNITYNSALVTDGTYIMGWAAGLTANSNTAPTNWDESCDLAYTTPSTNMAVNYGDSDFDFSSAGPYTCTAASSTWSVMGCEIWNTGAGPKSGGFFNAQ